VTKRLGGRRHGSITNFWWRTQICKKRCRIRNRSRGRTSNPQGGHGTRSLSNRTHIERAGHQRGGHLRAAPPVLPPGIGNLSEDLRTGSKFTRGTVRDALAALDIQPICASSEVASIPERGPLVVAANHPHGALDGLLLLSVIRRVRPDIRVLTNHLLSRIPELADLCFFVDPFGGPAATARSQSGLRAAHLWLREAVH
jgi:hypothetical protein